MTADDLQRWLSDNVISHGTSRMRPQFKCPDGFKVSIQASVHHYCSPRDNEGPYTSVELGFPTERVEALLPYAEEPDQPTETVYGWVPLDVVAAVLTAHGA